MVCFGVQRDTVDSEFVCIFVAVVTLGLSFSFIQYFSFSPFYSVNALSKWVYLILE